MRLFLRALCRALAVLMVLAPAAAWAQQIGGYTNMSVDSQHGTQIEYLSPGGKTFLWYPGNTVILPGRWKREGQNICFSYGANTYNPATGQRGGGWECMEFRLWWWANEQRMPGDIFGLEHRTEVPYRLDRNRTTLEKVLARVSPGVEAPPLEVQVLAPGAELSLSCASILANAERSQGDAQVAVGTLFSGRFMGKPCGRVDYDGAFALAQRFGISFEPFARKLRERASIGHPTAISALERLGL